MWVGLHLEINRRVLVLLIPLKERIIKRILLMEQVLPSC